MIQTVWLYQAYMSCQSNAGNPSCDITFSDVSIVYLDMLVLLLEKNLQQTLSECLFKDLIKSSLCKSQICAIVMLSFLQNCALKKLEEFSISYNWLGDSAGTSLAVILNRCSILTTLRIESCGLTSHVTAQGKEFPVALKGRYTS